MRFLVGESLLVNGAGAGFDQPHAESGGEGIHDAEVNAEIRCKSGNVYIRHAEGAQVVGEVGVMAAAVVVESAVAVGMFVHAFAEDGCYAPRIQFGMEICAFATGNAVIRPEDLFQPMQFNDVKRFFAGMCGSKAFVPGRMPILGGNDERVVLHQGIHGGDDGIAIRYGQATAWHEVVLDIYEQKGTHGNLPVMESDP